MPELFSMLLVYWGTIMIVFFFCAILIAHRASLFCMIFHPTKTGICGEKEEKKTLQCLDMMWYPAFVAFKITNIIKLLWFPCQDSLSYLHRNHFQSFLSSNYSLLSFIPHQLLEKNISGSLAAKILNMYSSWFCTMSAVWSGQNQMGSSRLFVVMNSCQMWKLFSRIYPLWELKRIQVGDSVILRGFICKGFITDTSGSWVRINK